MPQILPSHLDEIRINLTALLEVIKRFPNSTHLQKSLVFILEDFEIDQQRTIRSIYNFLGRRGPKNYRDLFYPDADKNFEDLNDLRRIDKNLRDLL